MIYVFLIAFSLMFNDEDYDVDCTMTMLRGYEMCVNQLGENPFLQNVEMCQSIFWEEMKYICKH